MGKPYSMDLRERVVAAVSHEGLSRRQAAARFYGRSARGSRCVGHVPHGHWKTTTFVGGLRCSGMTAPMVLDGPMNGAAFIAYVERCWCRR